MGFPPVRSISSPPESKANKRWGRLPDHDPAKNEIHAIATKAAKEALAANIEKKICIYSGASSVLNNGTMICLTANLVRGDAAVNEATGILIKPKKLRIRLTWSNAAPYNTYRFIVFRWMDASAVTPAGVLITTASPLAPLSPLSWVNRRKIKVLYDHQDVLFDHGSTVAAKTHCVTINPGVAPIQLPLSGAGAIPQMNGIYLLLITDDSITPNPACDLYSELEYTDA